MKYSEDVVCQRSELGSNLKRIINDLLGSRLAVEGQNVELPADQDLELKVKHNTEETGGSFTLKISWDLAVEEEIEIEE